MVLGIFGIQNSCVSGNGIWFATFGIMASDHNPGVVKNLKNTRFVKNHKYGIGIALSSIFVFFDRDLLDYPDFLECFKKRVRNF
jgi:hypothetical protein